MSTLKYYKSKQVQIVKHILDKHSKDTGFVIIEFANRGNRAIRPIEMILDYPTNPIRKWDK